MRAVKDANGKAQENLGDCLTCGEGTPAVELVVYGNGFDPDPLCADCAAQVKHLITVSRNRSMGARKAADTRRANRLKPLYVKHCASLGIYP
jgi:hypothetical protein